MRVVLFLTFIFISILTGCSQSTSNLESSPEFKEDAKIVVYTIDANIRNLTELSNTDVEVWDNFMRKYYSSKEAHLPNSDSMVDKIYRLKSIHSEIMINRDVLIESKKKYVEISNGVREELNMNRIKLSDL